MAALQQTASGDFTTWIAGKIWEKVKEIDSDDEKKASPEVKQAAKDIKKPDNNSIPVKDDGFRDNISKIFGVDLDARLIGAESKIEKLGESVSILGQGVIDVQKLVIEQNSLLEDKLGVLLDVLNTQGRFQKKQEEDAKELDEALQMAKQGKNFGSKGLASTVKAGMETPFANLLRFGFGRLQARILRITGRFLNRMYIKYIPKALRRFVNIPRYFKAYGVYNLAKRRAASQLAKKGITSGVSKFASRRYGMKAAKTALPRIMRRMGVRSTAGNVPLLGFGTGLFFAFQRLSEGDRWGALLELASGIMGGVGFFKGSIAMDAAILSRDIERSGLTKEFNEMRGGYEFGTYSTKKGHTMLHGTEAIIGSDDRSSILDSAINSVEEVVNAACYDLDNDIRSGVVDKISFGKGGGESVEEIRRSQPNLYIDGRDFGETRINAEGKEYKHVGEDYSVPSGTGIVMLRRGKVNEKYFGHEDPIAGGNVLIDHPGGKSTRYLHLSKIFVKPGDAVSAGEVIGLTGGAQGEYGQGNSTGSHLHLEYYDSEFGAPVDPLHHADKFFKFDFSPTAETDILERGKGGDEGLDKLKKRIRVAESSDNYKAVYSGALSNFPGRDKDITKMTIQEVYDHQTDYLNYQRDVLKLPSEKRSAAMGAYQLLYVRTAADDLGIPRTALFNKETQDKLVMWWLDPQWTNYQKGKITAIQFNDYLAGQFASLQTSSGSGVYDGDGINQAHNNILELIESLKPNNKGSDIIPPLPPIPDEMFEKSGILEDMEQMVALTQPVIVLQNTNIGTKKGDNTAWKTRVLQDNYLEHYRIASLGV